MTQERFNELMNNYLQSLAKEEPSPWSQEAREWCESNGIIEGGSDGHKMYRKPLTREEMASILFKLHTKGFIK